MTITPFFRDFMNLYQDFLGDNELGLMEFLLLPIFGVLALLGAVINALTGTTPF